MDSSVQGSCFHIHIIASRKSATLSPMLVPFLLSCIYWVNGYLHENTVAEHLVLTICTWHSHHFENITDALAF